MHVLIIPSWYPVHPGDVNGSFFREQAVALSKQGCRVGVIYPELHSLRDWKLLFSDNGGVSVTLDDGVLTYRSRCANWFPRLPRPTARLFVWRGCRLFDRYFAENGLPDVIHAHSMLYAGTLAARISNDYAVPFVVTEHSSAFALDMISATGAHIAKRVFSMATRTFAVSKALATILQQQLSPDGAHWEEMPNIVNERFINNPLVFRGHHDSLKFVNIGFMKENKRQGNILRAFAQVSRDHSEISLTVGGDGPERGNLELLARDLGIEQMVDFTGLLTREQVLTTMADADVFILASAYETFGVVVIEALALGKPVIATKCGGPDSIVREQDGILIAVDDVSALATAMRQMIENRTSYDAAEIRNSCIARYGEHAVVNRLKQAYTDVISEYMITRRGA